MLMFKKMIVGCILTSVLALCICLLIVSYSPKTLLTVVKIVTPYTVTADRMNITLISPSITAHQLLVSQHDKQVAVKVENISLATTWEGWFKGTPQWSGTIESGSVYIDQFSPPKNSNTANSATSTQIPTATKVHELIGMFGIAIRDMNIYVNKNEVVNIAYLNGAIEKTLQKQGVDFGLTYKKDDMEFPVKGSFFSEIDHGAPTFIVDIPMLDFRLLNQTSAPSDVQGGVKGDMKEGALDWAWISALAPLDIVFRSNMLAFDQGKLAHVESTVNLLNNTITQRHSGNLQLSLNDDYGINEQVLLTSTWQPLAKNTQGADVKGHVLFSLGKNTFNLKGDFNLNGIADNQWQVQGDVIQFPVEVNSLSAKQLQQHTQSFFPFSAKANVQLNENIASLSDMQFTAGQSDINGHIDLLFNAEGLSETVFELQSTLWVMPVFSEVKKPKVNNKKVAESTNISKLFTNERIPLDVLNTLVVNGNLKVKTLVYGDRVLLKGLENNVTLKNKHLSVTGQADDLAGGQLEARLVLNNQADQPQLSVDISMQEAVLESLALLPKDELTGGNTNVTVSLLSQGQSTQALAESLNGSLLLEIREGTIENNSFELVGSDLILNILNAINPFYKKAKNTQLECAVVKSKIKNGRLLFEDSVKIVTSQMIVVGDGYVDLASESINVNVNPTARSGVGVDVASLAKFVALKGTLSQPEIGASASGTLKSIASVGAAMSTGGLSLLAKSLVDKATAGKACDSALLAFNK